MKSIFPLVICLFLFLNSSLQAQENYTVNGETYSLKSDIKGNIELLWNVIDSEYRYFIKKGDHIEELKNTKQDGKYQQEYKQVLAAQTADANISTKNVNLTLPSLRSFFAEYNSLKDPNFSEVKKDIQLKFLLGGYLGVTNSVYTKNIDNDSQAVVGLELELTDPTNLKRHSMVLDFKHTFEGGDSKYTVSQFGLNYRFKFVKTPKFDLYVNAKFAALSFYKKGEYTNNAGDIVPSDSGSSFNSPLSLGLGADYKVGNGYITFGYHDFVALNMDSNKEFPIDFSLGYKFHL